MPDYWHTGHFSVPQTHSIFPDLKALNPMFPMQCSARGVPPALFAGKLCPSGLVMSFSLHIHMAPLLQRQ